MNHFKNKSEEFVYQACRHSFLSLWSYANPKGKAGHKELCDILVVCDPDIVIVSVKEITFTNSGNISTDLKRWWKRAIESSVKQIYGAERFIRKASYVIRSDGKLGLPFPKMNERRIHRIAVALGGKSRLPIPFGNFRKGFVHVFDEISFMRIMSELDTITDFIRYLRTKEKFCEYDVKREFQGGEENLIAYYLFHNRDFPIENKSIIIKNDLWVKLINMPEYKSKKEADNDSYVWDILIEIISDDIISGQLEFGQELKDNEIAVRIMSREDRFNRRMLGNTFMDFYDIAKQKKVRSRVACGQSDVTYVFLAMPQTTDRTFRVAELGTRCFIARGLIKNRKTVIGIATEKYEKGKGYSFDLIYQYKENWTDEDQQQMEFLQKEFGFFESPQKKTIHEDEYPSS